MADMLTISCGDFYPISDGGYADPFPFSSDSKAGTDIAQSCFGVYAPGGYVDHAHLKQGARFLSDLRLDIKVHPQSFEKEAQMAGSLTQKSAALRDLLRDDDVKAILCAGGGNRCLHSLPFLDWTRYNARPKPIIGYSDVTALLNAALSQMQNHYQKTACIGLHGPTLNWAPRHDDRPGEASPINQWQYALSLLKAPHDYVPYPSEAINILRAGSAKGPLIGGNLSVFRNLVGTRWLPDLTGAILFFEDIGDELSWFDRDLWFLKESGALSQISGLIFGQFSQKDTGRPFGYSLPEIIDFHTKDLKIPVLYNAPFGHQDDLFALPVGGYGHINCT